MFDIFRKIIHTEDERGVAATEYAIIAALIAVVAAGAMNTVGNEVDEQNSAVASAVRSANDS